MIGKRLGKERQEAKERLITRERSEPPLIHPSLPPSHLPPLYIQQDSLRPLFCVAHWRCHLRHGRPRAARAGPSRRRAGAEAAAATLQLATTACRELEQDTRCCCHHSAAGSTHFHTVSQIGNVALKQLQPPTTKTDEYAVVICYALDKTLRGN